MASIDERPDGRYRTRWREYPGGPQKTRHFDRERDADRWLAEVTSGLAKGTYVDPQGGRVTLKDYAEQWMTSQVWRPSTQAQVETNLRRHVYPELGDRPIASIRPSELRAWVKGRSEVLAAPTVELIYRYLVSVYRSAIADRIVAVSPCVGIRLPKQDRRPVQPLTVEQVEALTLAMPARYQALIVLAAGTGLRQGECFGLTADRIDWLRRQLTVDQQLVTVQGQRPKFAPPKTAASYRTVPLPDVVLEALSAHHASHPPATTGLVFTNDRCEPINRSRFSDVWRPAARLVGLPPGTGLHALRHFYASLLIRHGESVKVVQSRLGHASASETLDTYSHL